jgi:hypothetical protein
MTLTGLLVDDSTMTADLYGLPGVNYVGGRFASIIGYPL